MSYGYIQGQESQALVYYKKLVQTTANPDERKKLEAIIAFLEKAVADKPQAAMIGENSISNNASMVAHA